MKLYEKKALKLPWSDVAEIASIEIAKIIGRQLCCTAGKDDVDYWCFSFREDRMPLSEVYKILETVKATKEQRMECIPPESEHMTSVNGLGMAVCSLLLQRHFGYEWECEHLEEDALWLLGEKLSENALQFK